MFNIRDILSCALWNLRSMRKNPRTICGLFLGFGLCFFLTQRIIELAGIFHTNTEIFEPFIWCFADADSILFASLAILLPLSQMPQLNSPAYYLIFRKGRMNWLFGQILTAVIISFGYTLLLLGSAMVLTLHNSFWHNAWSDTATILSFAPEEFEVALTVVRKTVKLTTPYDCVVMIFFLVAQYILFLTFVNLLFSLKFGKKSGMTAVIAVSLYAYLLNQDKLISVLHIPQEITYIAHTIAAWISPLNHAAYSMHSFGYGNFPSIVQSHLLFTVINVFLLLCSYHMVKHSEFIFLGGSHE